MVNYGLGVPVKVLHEAEGHIVTVEASTGETYRGTLIEAEDNMNLQVLIFEFLNKNFWKNVNPFSKKIKKAEFSKIRKNIFNPFFLNIFFCFQMRDVTATYRDGRDAHLSNIYIR